MSDTNITEEMIERGARATVYLDWDSLMPANQEFYRHKAREVLRAALAGYTVIELPAPEETRDDGFVHADMQWGNSIDSIGFFADGNDGRRIYSWSHDWITAEQAEKQAAMLLAAAAEDRRRRASESSGGETHG